MRTHAFMRITLLLLVLAFPALVRAQFQQPTDEELKMTADPKAPGAAAVYLNVEEVTDDPLHFHSVYARIKILQEKAKDLATVEVPYERSSFKVQDIKARTIHADGTVIPLQGKPEDLLISKDKDRQFGRMVFTLPSVEIGSILEYRYQLRYDDNQYSSPTWEIQRPYFVRKAHYSFTPFKAFLSGIQNQTSAYLQDAKGRVDNTLMWWPVLPAGTQIKPDASGRYSVDITDVPPIPNEEWMPPIRAFLYKVRFYYTYAPSAVEFWNTEAKSWSKAVDHFAEQSKPIHEAVSGLIAPTDSDLDKAKKLYKAVQALDNTDFSREKGKSELKQLKLKVAKRAEDTWKQKSGSSEDLALLYLAMLRAAGLSARAMKVVDREQGVFDPTYMNFDQLDDTIVLLTIGGKEIPLDPGEKMCPFQTVHWRHSAASGAQQGPDNHNAGTTPVQPYPSNKTTRIGDVFLDEHGAVTANIRILMTGQQALYWRQQALRNDEDEVKKRFDHWLESNVPQGIEAHLVSFTGLDNPDVDLVALIKANGNLGTPTSKRLLIPGFFFQTRGSHPFVSEDKRLEDVDMQYGDVVFDKLTYHFPAGFSVEGAPQDSKIDWPQHAVFATKSVPSPGQILIARQLSRAFTFAKAADYQDLRAFYQKIAAADQQQLVLTTAPAPKGN